MPYLTVDRENSGTIELYYEDHGSGYPVVLIHGWPLSGRSWEQQVPALVDTGHRVVTYDRRGFGRSSQPWAGYEYDTLAADLHTLLDKLNLGAVTLVGFSMGGGEVARYLARYGPGRVARAVFAASVTPYLYTAADNPEGGLDDAAIASFEEGVRSDRLTFLDGFTSDFFSDGSSTLVSEASRLHHRDIAAFASPRGTLACVGAFGRTDFRGDLASITVPTLVLHGDADQIVPFEVSGARTHASVPHSELALIDGGTHGLNTTHAREFNRALLDFLAR